MHCYVASVGTTWGVRLSTVKLLSGCPLEASLGRPFGGKDALGWLLGGLASDPLTKEWVWPPKTQDESHSNQDCRAEDKVITPPLSPDPTSRRPSPLFSFPRF